MARRKRITRARSCKGKGKHTEWAAKRKAERLAKKDGARMHAYRCKFKCYLKNGSRAWHVGHIMRAA